MKRKLWEEEELELKLLDLSLAVGKTSFGGKKLQAFSLFCCALFGDVLGFLSPKLITLCVNELLEPEICPMLAH